MNYFSAFTGFFWSTKEQRYLIHLLPDEIINMSLSYMNFPELVRIRDATSAHFKTKDDILKRIFSLVKSELLTRNYYEQFFNSLNDEQVKKYLAGVYIFKVINENNLELKKNYQDVTALTLIPIEGNKKKSFFQKILDIPNSIKAYSNEMSTLDRYIDYIDNYSYNDEEYKYTSGHIKCHHNLFCQITIHRVETKKTMRKIKEIKIFYYCDCEKYVCSCKQKTLCSILCDNKFRKIKDCPCKQKVLETIFGKAEFYETEKYCFVFNNTQQKIKAKTLSCDKSFFFEYDLMKDHCTVYRVDY
ncbi:hypothetical protein Catovirus_1_477 [Catovirus CTV1]|uniref:Uncharacterized protein n=1 Tax=Catovirus CTV1 TaxID=1977631 RepID=A0A1V0S9N5_9VIRU|nr:hypothetical protein Catovirus_1_477 [Catovirus CTV1]